MAVRPVFVPGKRKNEADVFMTEFQWNSGMSASQKRKNIDALHEAFMKRFPEKKVLEISSKSRQDLGIKLSAFNLQKFVPELEKSIPVECVYQGGKVFSGAGPFTDLYGAIPRDAKRDPRLRSNGMLRNFQFDGRDFPITPANAFYNWIYINALIENPDLAEEVLQYDGFTDIEFNPNKSLNCQAAAAALYVSLQKRGLLSCCKDFSSFVDVVGK